jgi:hypothetical protein
VRITRAPARREQHQADHASCSPVIVHQAPDRQIGRADYRAPARGHAPGTSTSSPRSPAPGRAREQLTGTAREHGRDLVSSTRAIMCTSSRAPAPGPCTRQITRADYRHRSPVIVHQHQADHDLVRITRAPGRSCAPARGHQADYRHRSPRSGEQITGPCTRHRIGRAAREHGRDHVGDRIGRLQGTRASRSRYGDRIGHQLAIMAAIT